MIVSHSLLLPINTRVNCRAVLAWSSRSADDYLRFPAPSLGTGGLFFHAIENAARYLAKPFRGGPLAFSILHFPSLDRSSLNAIKHRSEARCVENSEQIIINPRVKS